LLNYAFKTQGIPPDERIRRGAARRNILSVLDLWYRLHVIAASRRRRRRAAPSRYRQ